MILAASVPYYIHGGLQDNISIMQQPRDQISLGLPATCPFKTSGAIQ